MYFCFGTTRENIAFIYVDPSNRENTVHLSTLAWDNICLCDDILILFVFFYLRCFKGVHVLLFGTRENIAFIYVDPSNRENTVHLSTLAWDNICLCDDILILFVFFYLRCFKGVHVLLFGTRENIAFIYVDPSNRENTVHLSTFAWDNICLCDDILILFVFFYFILPAGGWGNTESGSDDDSRWWRQWWRWGGRHENYAG